MFEFSRFFRVSFSSVSSEVVSLTPLFIKKIACGLVSRFRIVFKKPLASFLPSTSSEPIKSPLNKNIFELMNIDRNLALALTNSNTVKRALEANLPPRKDSTKPSKSIRGLINRVKERF